MAHRRSKKTVYGPWVFNEGGGMGQDPDDSPETWSAPGLQLPTRSK